MGRLPPRREASRSGQTAAREGPWHRCSTWSAQGLGDTCLVPLWRTLNSGRRTAQPASMQPGGSSVSAANGRTQGCCWRTGAPMTVGSRPRLTRLGRHRLGTDCAPQEAHGSGMIPRQPPKAAAPAMRPCISPGSFAAAAISLALRDLPHRLHTRGLPSPTRCHQLQGARCQSFAAESCCRLPSRP